MSQNVFFKSMKARLNSMKTTAIHDESTELISRDPIKEASYFHQFIATETKSIADFQKSLKRKKVAPGQEPSVLQAIFQAKLEILIARYSMGDLIETLVRPYLDLVHEMTENWDAEDYQTMLWMMSLGILFNISRENFSVLAALVEKYHMRDYVLQYFIDCTLDLPPKANEYPIKFERRLVTNIIEPIPDIASANIKKYLKSWYTFNHGSYWYDLHKSDQSLYFGYWCFECGAVAKIRGLDDSEVKGAQFYPYDLVHFSSENDECAVKP